MEKEKGPVKGEARLNGVIRGKKSWLHWWFLLLMRLILFKGIKIENLLRSKRKKGWCQRELLSKRKWQPKLSKIMNNFFHLNQRPKLICNLKPLEFLFIVIIKVILLLNNPANLLIIIIIKRKLNFINYSNNNRNWLVLNYQERVLQNKRNRVKMKIV